MDRNFNDGNVGNNSMAFSSCKVCDDCNIGVKRKLYSQSENDKYLKKSRTDTEAVSRINRSNKVSVETNEELEDPRATASDVERSNLQENYPPPPLNCDVTFDKSESSQHSCIPPDRENHCIIEMEDCKFIEQNSTSDDVEVCPENFETLPSIRESGNVRIYNHFHAQHFPPESRNFNDENTTDEHRGTTRLPV